MVSSRFLGSRSVLALSGFAVVGALGACGVSGNAGDFVAEGGSAGVGSGASFGSGPAGGGAPAAGGSPAGSAGSVVSGAGAAPVSGGAPGAAGSPSAGGTGGGVGATCAGTTAWTLGTTASNVSHNGKKYSCKQAGWCASTAAAYEPGVGFAWQDAWEDDGSCGTGGGGGAPSTGGAPGSAGATGSGGAPSVGCALDSLLGESNFNAWYPKRNGFYTYANLCKAIGKYPAFATTGDDTAKKREVAAFFANVARETGSLLFVEEINKNPDSGNYFGRGPLQITWNYNYQACGNAIGENLIGNPGLVSSDGAVTWETGLWFWMTNDGGTGKTPHQAIVAGNFGGTINAINGGLECKGPNEGANERIAHYQTYTQALGVDPGSSLTCW